jgi:nitrogen regulatory protein PII-like uncharacterized protein
MATMKTLTIEFAKDEDMEMRYKKICNAALSNVLKGVIIAEMKLQKENCTDLDYSGRDENLEWADKLVITYQ